uniref:Secreted protein n=1 Tax=Knipowitschia caucasica TaxID=637954 RepID=A0AAV2K586_KNICA
MGGGGGVCLFLLVSATNRPPPLARRGPDPPRSPVFGGIDDSSCWNWHIKDSLMDVSTRWCDKASDGPLTRIGTREKGRGEEEDEACSTLG